MWQRFTERARKAVFYAQEEAQRFGEGYVSTEHLLLGLVREPDNVAMRVLAMLGVSPELVREEVERLLPMGDTRPYQDMTLTPRAKRVIDLAYDEARNLNNNYIGTEHILLGLIREEGGLAGRVLAKLRVDLDAARNAVRQLQGQAPTEATPEQKPGFLEQIGFGRSKRHTVRAFWIALFGCGRMVPEFQLFLRGAGLTALPGPDTVLPKDETALEAAFRSSRALAFFVSPGSEDAAYSKDELLETALVAVSMHPDRAIVVCAGDVGPIPDDLAPNVLTLTNEEKDRIAVLNAFRRAGCFGEGWKTSGNFDFASESA